MRNVFTVFLLCCCSAFAFAQSRPPTPSPVKAAALQQQQDTNKNEPRARNNTSAQPSIPNVIGPKIDFKSRNSPDDSQEHSPADWWGRITSALIVVVMAFQAWIYCRQTGIMGSTLAETKKAADAAKTGAEAAKLSADTSERALRLCEVAELQIVDMALPPFFRPEESIFTFTYKNFGRTIATDVVSKVGFDDRVKPNNFAPRATIAAGEMHKFPVPIPADDVVRITHGERRLDITVITTYRDVFGEKQEIEFLGTYSYERAQFEWMCSKHRIEQE